MTAQPVASVPKDMMSPRAAAPVATASSDFAQLLDDNAPSSTSGASTSCSSRTAVASASTGSTSTTTTATSSGRPSKKSSDDGSTPTNVVVPFSVPHSAPQLKTDTQDAAPTQATTAANAVTDTASAASRSATDTATAPTAQPTAGNATAAGIGLPAAAGDMNMRIEVGMPSFYSQPGAMLTGAPHVAAAAAPDDDADVAPSSSDASTDDAAATGSATKALALRDLAATEQAHDASPADASFISAPDPGSAPVAAGSQPSDVPPISLPAASDNAGAPATATVATVAVSAPNIAPLPIFEQVAFSLRQASDGDGGLNTINIQLKPASLGAIQVKLDIGHDGKISAVISADRSDTLNLLRQDSQGLEQSLRDAGLKADSGSLSFNLRGEQQNSAQQSPSAPALPGYAQRSETAASDAVAPRYSRHTGALDIEV